MSSSNRRERELARAKRERQLEAAKNRSQKKQSFSLFAVIGVFCLLVIGYMALSSGNSPEVAASQTPTQSATPTPSSDLNCSPAPAAVSNPQQWSTAPAADLNSGTAQWILTTNCGEIVIDLLPSKAPQTVSSFAFLTDKNYFDNTPCHRLTTAGLYVLQCGDPTGTGTGGPGYAFTDENLPTDVAGANYPTGTVAMANSGPNTNGSQFFIVFGDTTLNPAYTVFGKVTAGLDIVQAIAAAGVADGSGDGSPAQGIGILDAKIVKG